MAAGSRFTETMTLVLAMIVSGAPLTVLAQQTSARVVQGDLSGIAKGKVTAYLGVPFAAPPLADLRWRAPAPAAAWTGTRNAHALSPSCQQALPTGAFRAWTEEYLIKGSASEDCLYLNVWTPARSARERLPVLVWIHGGAFLNGGTSVPIYDGAALASQGIIVVTINYRVGLYGFMAHPALGAENPAGASGNYGLLDQIAALRWIKENAAAFGGDAARVTIAGQSAGAASVHHLIASPMASGLFQRAIAQSGSGMGIQVPERAAAQATAEQVMQASGATDIAALRALAPEQLDTALAKLAAGGVNARFGPVVDGLVLPDASHVGANTNDTPILTGMTADEGSSIFPNYGKATPASLQASIAASYGALAGEFSAMYGAASDAQAGAAAMALARERGLASMHVWAQRRMATSRQPIYAYLWNHVEPGPDAALYRAFHSSEIAYVFGTLDTAPRPFTAQDRALSKQVGSYWVNWVKSGNPNGPGLKAWPRLTKAAPRIMGLGGQAGARPILEPGKLRLYERHVLGGGTLGLF